MTKPTYILTNDDLEPIYDPERDDGAVTKHKSEKDALKAATKEVKELGFDREVWVWKLSHVVSTPTEVDVITEHVG